MPENKGWMTLVSIVKHYSRKFNVNIEVNSGEQAYSTHNKIVIPNLDINNPLLARLTYGFLAHESAHLRYSNFDCNKHINNQLFKEIVNALEDSRVEKLISSSFIGVNENLRLLNNTLALSYIEKFDELYKYTKFQILLAYIFFKGQCVLLDYNYSQQIAERLYDELVYLVNVDDLKDLDQKIKTLSKVNSTVDVVGVALKIYQVLKRPGFFTPNIESFYKYYKLNNTEDFNFCKQFAASLNQSFEINGVNLDHIKALIRYESNLNIQDLKVINSIDQRLNNQNKSLNIFAQKGNISPYVVESKINNYFQQHNKDTQTSESEEPRISVNNSKQENVVLERARKGSSAHQESFKIDYGSNTDYLPPSFYGEEDSFFELDKNFNNKTKEVSLHKKSSLKHLEDINGSTISNQSQYVVHDVGRYSELFNQPFTDVSNEPPIKLELPIFSYSMGDPIKLTGVFDIQGCRPEYICNLSRTKKYVNLDKVLTYFRSAPLSRNNLYGSIAKCNLSKLFKERIFEEGMAQKYRQDVADTLRNTKIEQTSSYEIAKAQTEQLLNLPLDIQTHSVPAIQLFDSEEQRKKLVPQIDQEVFNDFREVEDLVPFEHMYTYEENQKKREILRYQRRIKILEELGLFDSRFNLHPYPPLDVTKYVKLNNGHVILFPDPYSTVNYDGTYKHRESLRTKFSIKVKHLGLVERLEDTTDYNQRDPRLENTFLDAWHEYFSEYKDHNETKTIGISAQELLSKVAEIQEQSKSSRDNLNFSGEICKSHKNANFINSIEKSVYDLRKVLYQKVKAWVESQHDNNAVKGRNIDSRKAIKIPFGETHIFKRRFAIEDYSTLIHLLIDISGSMCANAVTMRIRPNYAIGDSRAYYACKTALAIALALDGIDGITTEATFFPGDKGSFKSALLAHERIQNVKNRFYQEPQGSTPMAECVWFAIDEALRLRKSRNIVIVITDGVPNSLEQTKAALKACKENNIEVYAIGLNYADVLKDLFEHYKVMTDFTQLPKLMKELICSLFSLDA